MTMLLFSLEKDHVALDCSPESWFMKRCCLQVFFLFFCSTEPFVHFFREHYGGKFCEISLVQISFKEY